MAEKALPDLATACLRPLTLSLKPLHKVYIKGICKRPSIGVNRSQEAGKSSESNLGRVLVGDESARRYVKRRRDGETRSLHRVLVNRRQAGATAEG